MAGKRVLHSSLGSIFSHLALEEVLVSTAKTPTLFIWRNAPTVVIGRHQNPWKECRVDHLEHTGVDLCRRYSGGGAVYQDMGCTQFTFVYPEISDQVQPLIDANYALLVSALQSLGLASVVRSGRNDIAIDHTKISGSAFKIRNNTLLHHGTILVNTDLTALGNLLTPDARKLQSKGIDSVRKRVANISDHQSSLNHDSLADAIFREFARHEKVEYICNDLVESEIYSNTLSHLKSWEWRFGRTPPFTHSFATRVEGLGGFDVGLVVQDGLVADVLVHSDVLDVSVVEELEERLRGVRYTSSDVRKSMGLPLEDPPLSGAQCSASAVREANSHHLHCVLQELANTTFFRLARVDLGVPEDCNEDADVGDCTAPAMDAAFGESSTQHSACSIHGTSEEEEGDSWDDDEEEETVVRSITASEKQSLERSSEFPGAAACSSSPQFWKDLCEETPGNFPLVNLVLNPERNTGYDGSTVWSEIYAQIDESQHFLRKLVSGWHASISVHIAKEYKFEGGAWVANATHYGNSVKKFPERLENMHFTYVVLLRALYKAKAVLDKFDYKTASGDVQEDARTNELMRHLLDSSVLSVCDALFHGFDESEIFGPSTTPTPASAAVTELKTAFQRVFRLVRCKVKCQRCKLHATVALRGIGTALKILAISDPTEVLTRDDLVALINVLKELSVSIIHADSLARELGNHNADDDIYDLVVVGGGLAGLSAAVAAGERGARVLLIEKEKTLGGNSAKASSGINRAFDVSDQTPFVSDTLRSGGGLADETLDLALVNRSIESVEWLAKQAEVNLSQVGILGGHSRARTFRPEKGLVGAELVAGMASRVADFRNIRVITSTRVSQLLIDHSYETREDSVVGVLVSGGVPFRAKSVLLASGGFGHSEFFMRKYRPDLLGYPRTLGEFTSGDAFRLVESLPVELLHMAEVQLHPSAFVDPKDPDNLTKTLAAEILRGVGGMLLDPATKTRFVNELGERKFVTDTIERVVGKQVPVIFLASEQMLAECPVHRDLYVRRGLLRKISLAELTTDVILAEELAKYLDKNGKTKPYKDDMVAEISELPATWYIAQVVPVIHYTMGGIAIDQFGRVKSLHGGVISGLYAAGEVSGGVHGKNRLGGNSLLECVVFGKTVGQHILISDRTSSPPLRSKDQDTKTLSPPRPVTMEEVRKHSSPADCWTVIHSLVYDLSGYASEHPGGAASIAEACGQDATLSFDAVHTSRILTAGGFTPIAILA